MLYGKNSKKGYAMVVFLMLLVILTTLTASLGVTLQTSSENARESAARNDARSLAISVLESAYGEIYRNPVEFNKFINPETRSQSLFTAPALDKIASDIPSQKKWFAYNQTGSKIPYSVLTTECADYERDCVRLTINTLQDDSGGNTTREILLKVSTRVDCRGVEQGCVFSEFEQRLRKAQFYDYLYFNDSASLSNKVLLGLGLPFNPNICAKSLSQLVSSSNPDERTCLEYVPAFTKNDIVKGKTYIKDDFLLICPGLDNSNNIGPSFTGSIHVAGSGYQTGTGTEFVVTADKVRNDPGCTPNGSISAGLPSAGSSPVTMTFPTTTELGLDWNGNPCNQSEVLASNLQDLPTDSPIRKASIENSIICITSTTGTPELLFTEIGLSIQNGVAYSTLNPSTPLEPQIPYNGKLLYIIPGITEVKISGSVQGFTTVITKGGVEITGNLTKANNSSAIAVVAQDEINIKQSSASVTVQAVLVSLNQSVLNREWLTSPTVSTLQFTGTLAGKYRTVLGSYEANTGSAVTGFNKDLIWDSSASNQRLPYLPTPKSDGWIRLGVSEIKS